MDDFKRGIWLEIRTKFATGRGLYICNELKAWMRQNGMLEYDATEEEQEAALHEVFPELAKLSDGKIWYTQSWSQDWTGLKINPPWFACEWPEPRLALIDYILTSTT